MVISLGNGIFFSRKKCEELRKTLISSLTKSHSISDLYTQSVLIRNGPIRSTGEILGFFKKRLVEL